VRASGNKLRLPARHGQNDCAVAVGRRNWTFAGSDEGGRRAAAMYTLIETAKLNGIDPRAWLADVLARLPGHPAQRIGELLPWNWQNQPPISAAA
jgi:transposase